MYPATLFITDSFKYQFLFCIVQACTLVTVCLEVETHMPIQLHKSLKIQCWDAKTPKQQQQKYTFQYPVSSISTSLNGTKFKQDLQLGKNTTDVYYF